MSSAAIVKRPIFPVAPSKRFHFNGIDGATGSYLLPSMTEHELARLAAGEELRPGGAETKALIAGVDPRRLDQTGWGVIFTENSAPEVREALKALLEHRQAEANAGGRELYRELGGRDGYRKGESKVQFLARHDLGHGPADPERLPYYLLLVGSPEEIPFEFQYQLDVQHAVGRLHFDAVEEYTSYAASVVAAEKSAGLRPRRIACFSVENPDDPVTRDITDELIEPLSQSLSRKEPDWNVRTWLRGEATKIRLTRLLQGEEPPALLLTGSHGMGFPCDDPRQRGTQGALLLSDWPGPDKWQGPIRPDHYFAAADVPRNARLQGLVVFHFACYSAGMPKWDGFQEKRRRLAPAAGLARLPQRLLSHPAGGALAVVGHVDRAWTWSFQWEETKVPQLQTFESAFLRLLDGYPVGAALEVFDQRYAELVTDLEEERRRWKRRESDDAGMLSRLWTASKDARNYVLLGDPAVRLSVTDTILRS